jgi:hypothetical protein
MTTYKISGILPDPVNLGDMLFPVDFTASVPMTLNEEAINPPIENQGQVGDCTGNGQVGAFGIFLDSVGKFVQLSEFFNYYFSRQYYNGGIAPTQDTGSTLACAMKSSQNYGICTEATWPSSDTALLETEPSVAAQKEAHEYMLTGFARINNQNQAAWYQGTDGGIARTAQAIKYALSCGFPVNIGLQVGYQLYEITGANASSVYPPIFAEGNPAVGGHDLVIVGWTTAQGGSIVGHPEWQGIRPVWIVRNSWGTGWGMNGYFYMDQDCIQDMSDIWVMQQITANGQVINGAWPNVATAPTPPTYQSTIAELVAYIYQTQFGRAADTGGEAFWAGVLEKLITKDIIAGAQGSDLAYMQTHPINVITPAPTDATTIADMVSYVYSEYFNHDADPAGWAYWEQTIIAVMTRQILAGAAPSDLQFRIANGIHYP